MRSFLLASAALVLTIGCDAPVDAPKPAPSNPGAPTPGEPGPKMESPKMEPKAETPVPAPAPAPAPEKPADPK